MEHMGQNGQDGYIDIMYIIFKENITTDKTNNRWIKGSNLSYIPQDLMVGRQKSEQIVMLFKLNSAPWSLEVRMSMPNTRYTKQDRKIDANAIFERGLRVKVFQKSWHWSWFRPKIKLNDIIHVCLPPLIAF